MTLCVGAEVHGAASKLTFYRECTSAYTCVPDRVQILRGGSRGELLGGPWTRTVGCHMHASRAAAEAGDQVEVGGQRAYPHGQGALSGARHRAEEGQANEEGTRSRRAPRGRSE